jgi:F0F1-type ATP synthase alpha subunit
MSTVTENLQTGFKSAMTDMAHVRESFTPPLTSREVGTVISVSSGIAKVSGLPGAGFEELVKFPGGVLGIVFNVDAEELGVVLLGDYSHLRAGDEVERTGRVINLAGQLRQKAGVEQAVAFGTMLHVSGSDAEALDRAILPFRTGVYQWEKIPSGLEDVFIHLMDKSKDNFSQ